MTWGFEPAAWPLPGGGSTYWSTEAGVQGSQSGLDYDSMDDLVTLYAGS